MGQLTSQSFIQLFISILLVFFAGVSDPLAAQEITAGAPHVYGPVSKADTLKSIAIRTINKRDFKLRDTMADIYYANPGAFVVGRSQILRSGVLLKLPEYLTWNVGSSDPAISTEKQETPKQTVSKAPPEPAPTSKSGSIDDTEIQLQLLKRQLSDMNAKLVENQEKSEINARLQGAYYLITAVIILILITLLIVRSRPKDKVILPTIQKPGATPQPKTEQKVSVASKTIAPEDAQATSKTAVKSQAIEPATPAVETPVAPASEETMDDDPTPTSPTTSLEEPTPMAPSMAYDDITPANPSLVYQDEQSTDTTGEEKDSNVSDIHEVIHDISGRFKGMSDDKEASNLALARVYMDLGDYQQAKPLLTSVHKSVTPEYARQAEDMIHELLQSQMFASSFNEIVGDLSENDDSTVTQQLEDLSVNNDPLSDVSGSFLADDNDDESRRELEMAQIFFELGDHNRCKQHLAVILGSDSPSFKTEAYALLKEIESKGVNDNDITTKSDLLPDDIGDQPVIKEITPPEKIVNKEQLDELSSQFMMISSNKNGTKLALAHVHFEMGEHDTALQLLKEIITSGDEECTPDAEALIKKIGGINQA